jgi:hypothetical protein
VSSTKPKDTSLENRRRASRRVAYRNDTDTDVQIWAREKSGPIRHDSGTPTQSEVTKNVQAPSVTRQIIVDINFQQTQPYLT